MLESTWIYNESTKFNLVSLKKKNSDLMIKVDDAESRLIIYNSYLRKYYQVFNVCRELTEKDSLGYEVP